MIRFCLLLAFYPSLISATIVPSAEDEQKGNNSAESKFTEYTEATIKNGSMESEMEKDQIKLKMSLDQAGQFIEFIRDIEKDKKVQRMDQFVGILEGNLEGVRGIVRLLFMEIMSNISALGAHIVKKYVDDNKEKGREMSEEEVEAQMAEAKVKLFRWKLYRVGSKLIKGNFLRWICGVRQLSQKIKFYKWWIRYRYQVDSVVRRDSNGEPINEIRKSIGQFYMETNAKFIEKSNEIQKENELLAEIMGKLEEKPSKYALFLYATREEQSDFDPETELPEEIRKVLMEKPINGAPIEILTERFPMSFYRGYLIQFLGGDHRAAKVYELEFHLRCEDGILLHEKSRFRADPNEGIKFKTIGHTKMSQWEVQKVFDNFYTFKEDNGIQSEGKFGCNKYRILDNNCVHFLREFVEALMEGDEKLKKPNWPPKILQQSFLTKKPFKNLTAQLVTGSMVKRNGNGEEKKDKAKKQSKNSD